ncbi:Alpha/beta hydrolase fold-1 [Dillenia turbinata]|uniref:Alpha/beta hydrolase fold-1 n=1 Tax=Dillenia turbinata TaxID=194707 RepID=A0AAN8V0L5_9MAGN
MLSSSLFHSSTMSTLLLFPRFPSLHSPPIPNSLSRSPFRFSSPFASMSSSAIEERENEKKNNGVALLWFKHDLRVDDHPGLLAASQYRTVLPLYIFDPRILSRYSDEMLELVLFAIEDLRKSLKEQGSNLMIRFGTAENVMEGILKEVKATAIFVEEEVEYDLRMLMENMKDTLARVPLVEGSLEFVQWHTPFYEFKNSNNLPLSYQDFKNLQLPITLPLLPLVLPPVEVELDWGLLPTFDEVKRFMDSSSGKLKERWTSIKGNSAKNLLVKKQTDWAKEELVLRERNISNFNYKNAWKKTSSSVFPTTNGNLVGGGTTAVSNALASYLRYSEGTSRSDWQELHEKLRCAESPKGASFGVLFRSALNLGIVSRRRVYYEAVKYEKERNAGFISPFGYSAATVSAAVDTVCSIEWYWLLALKNQVSNEGPCSVRVWRWNGYLIQYAVIGHEGPPILLVHGFGAFLEHYRDNMKEIAGSERQVWAITLLGFGRSEKPNVLYTELMWAELLRDFIIEVVGEPVHLVGNSLGGYFAAIVAGLWSDLVQSIVLINSAGDVIPEYTFSLIPRERQTSGVAWLGAQLLLPYLRLTLRDTVKSCYPTKPERADDWLTKEMLRASYDPGTVVVLESIFGFNLSIPLNFLLEGFEGRVLVIQGMNDPITNSKYKVAMLREYCIDVTVQELDAGHCPHDELPEDVNSILREWVFNFQSKGVPAV